MLYQLSYTTITVRTAGESYGRIPWGRLVIQGE